MMNPGSRFEDGTLNFISILTLTAGFNSAAQLGIDRISAHVWSLTSFLYEHMVALRHGNGAPVVTVYGQHAQRDPKVQGGVLSFNLLSPDGKYVSFDDVQRRAASHGIHMRSGCHCNPGACFGYLNLSNEQVSTYFVDKNSCGDGPSVVEDGTLPLGALRVSLGYLTTYRDVRAVLEFVRHYYVQSDPTIASSPF